MLAPKCRSGLANSSVIEEGEEDVKHADFICQELTAKWSESL